MADRGAYERCQEKALEALEVYRRTLPETHWRSADTRSVLGGCLVGLGLYDEAEPLLEQSYPVIRREHGDEAHYTRDALTRLSDLDAARLEGSKLASENQ